MKIIRNNEAVKAYKAKKPKLNSMHRCWQDTEVKINGNLHGVWWECMRGANYYILYEGQWYRIPFVIGDCFNAVDNLNDDVAYNEEWIIEKETL